MGVAAVILPHTWLEQVEELCEVAATAGAADEFELLRSLHALWQCAPLRHGTAGGSDLARAELEKLLHVGATESAAIQLVRPCGYMLSAGEFGIMVATINFPSVGEVSFSGDSEAIALCGALATALSHAFRLSLARSHLL